jgi:3-mercaptopyruvate sulfurtransferase SseA
MTQKEARQAMNLISRDELREKLDRGDRFNLVMTLSEHAYRSKHIPGSLYFETVDEALAALEPAEEIVVYCADVHCAASVYAYRFLEQAGYTRVRRYAGGVADWEEAGYPLDDDAPDPRTDVSVEAGQRPPAATTQGRTRRARRSWIVCPRVSPALAR